MTRILCVLLCAVAALAQDAGKPSSPSPRHTPRRAAAILRDQEFGAEVADALLARIGEGLTALSPRTVLSVFDRGRDQVYVRVKEQTTAWFEASREIRVHYMLQDWSIENGEARITAKFEVEQYPASSEQEPTRRNGILKLHAERTKDGWRIVAYDPEGFFLP